MEGEPVKESHSFCETSTPAPAGKWHIRALTDAGQKLGGGADTKALCGREVAWDVETPITMFHLSHSTRKACREAYKARNK